MSKAGDSKPKNVQKYHLGKNRAYTRIICAYIHMLGGLRWTNAVEGYWKPDKYSLVVSRHYPRFVPV